MKLCVAIIIFNIYLQVNNEYSDSAIDKTCKYKVKMNCNIFFSVDSLLSIYNKQMHQSSMGKQTITRNNMT